MYNGCVYPTEFDEQNIAKKVYNFVFSPYLKIPNRSNELEICFRAYLEDTFESIMQSRLSNWTMVHNDYHTIQTVYSELDSTKIRNIHTSEEVNRSSQTECKKVYNVLNVTNNSGVETASHTGHCLIYLVNVR